MPGSAGSGWTADSRSVNPPRSVGWDQRIAARSRRIAWCPSMGKNLARGGFDCGVKDDIQRPGYLVFFVRSRIPQAVPARIAPSARPPRHSPRQRGFPRCHQPRAAQRQAGAQAADWRIRRAASSRRHGRRRPAMTVSASSARQAEMSCPPVGRPTLDETSHPKPVSFFVELPHCRSKPCNCRSACYIVRVTRETTEVP